MTGVASGGRTIVLVGASSGLGHGLSCALPAAGDSVFLVSRRRPPSLAREDGVARDWVETDLAHPDRLNALRDAIGERPVDMLVFCAATWESDLQIERVSAPEIYRILSVNAASFVAVTAMLADNLRACASVKVSAKVAAKVVAIGSTFGLENGPGLRAAYAASKFGLRGAVNAFRDVFRADGIAVTCLSPGTLAPDGQDAGGSGGIPLADIAALLRCLGSTSAATCIKEVAIPAMLDLDA